MNEAAPQAAGGMSAADIEHALAMLEMVWGDGSARGVNPLHSHGV